MTCTDREKARPQAGATAAESPPQHADAVEAVDAELLDTGQEEVFSRTEVELGVIEHASVAGKTQPPKAPQLKSGKSGGAA